MPVSNYEGPSVFGYETDVLNRVAAISVHSSPLANLGSTDAGGMNVYVRELSCHIAATGLPVDVFTRRTDPETPEIQTPCDGVRVISITACPPPRFPSTTSSNTCLISPQKWVVSRSAMAFGTISFMPTTGCLVGLRIF